MQITKENLGFSAHNADADETRRMMEYVNLKLSARGCPTYEKLTGSPFMELAQSLLANIREKNRMLAEHLCPADLYIDSFLRDFLAEVLDSPDQRLIPSPTLSLERHGLARILSLPPDADHYQSEIINSYRVHQGVLHNPVQDRRTTKGVFHVCEGGFAVAGDKKTVPKLTFAKLLQAALNPPKKLLQLPFTSTQDEQAEVFVSLLLRPVVCPEVPGYISEKTMETRFFAPGGLVSNLDFVESIFGNAGDPFLTMNDARLDIEHWSGHTGCVILAPHLTTLRKKDLGLPHISAASDDLRRDGMYWESEDDLYNDGSAFKLTCRDHRGVIVTLIADNYFGYCKKEVKTQLSYAANLMGLCEEEHAGGVLAFPRFDLGEYFELSSYFPQTNHTYREVCENYGELMDISPTGYATDKTYPDIVYLPEDARIYLRRQQIVWNKDGEEHQLKLQPKCTYVLPSGYKVEMIQPQEGRRWRLIGANAEGTLCHKPCTVSGGGKSEISKSVTDAIITGPIITSDFKNDIQLVEQIIQRNFGGRYKRPREPRRESRSLLSPERSLGSVVRLLTPSPQYTDEYNAWVTSIPRQIRDLVLIVKRFYKPHWGEDWRSRFSVDSINGLPGYELKYRTEKLLASYMRVGFEEDHSWRTFDLRKDFYPAVKVQMEDDITASIVVPRDSLEYLHPDLEESSFKFVRNCEYRLFQRPDEAIVRGYDKTAEMDFSRTGKFFANYEPLTREDARNMVEDTILFGQFSKPIRKVINAFVKAEKPDYCVATSHPRLVNGRPSQNPRYLQTRPDLQDPRSVYLANLGARLHRRVPLGKTVLFPVNSVLPGRRNNPADHTVGIRPLAVYNPIHYQELPELFMEFTASLTGKSPSTTGAGSEGALTKGPFNAMPLVIDLNNALVSYLITGHSCFTTSAGYIGPKYRFDHDISLLIPDVWSRMFIHERDPKYLYENGYLEKLTDFEHQGQRVLASRLGYRITDKFVRTFFGRVFSDPTTVFNEQMLKPELQSMEDYVDGIDNIVSTQTRIAKLYLEDGTIDLACPPLKALLTIMAEGSYQGNDIHDESVRRLFTREALLESTWYQDRLMARRDVDRRLWKRHVQYLQSTLAQVNYLNQRERDAIAAKLEQARNYLSEIERPAYMSRLKGTIGVDPSVRST